MTEHGADGDASVHGHDHDHHHHDVASVDVAIVTISSSRALDEDPAGDAIEAAVETFDGAHVGSRTLVSDDEAAIADALSNGVDVADVVVTTGGTGITPDDVTIEVASERFEKEIPGFGELFRRRSEADIGERAMASRATAGVVEGTLVFCLPGSENAARTGIDLALPQLGHLAGLLDR